MGTRIHPGWHVLVVAAAGLVAWLGCRDCPGGWNDASRLATVECLVDHHTFAIDDSTLTPLTMDKLYIAGRFYSDKSPVPAVLMAVPYRLWEVVTGRTAASDPSGFCRFMTLTSSGLAYVVAVWCLFALGGPLRLTLPIRLTLAGSFGLCTLAPVYAQQVNNHVLLLGVSAGLVLVLVQFQQTRHVRWLLAAGLLAGLGYTIDLGVGPALVGSTGLLVTWRGRSWKALGGFVLALLPWLVLHHALNWSIGGTWKPANAVAEYLDYPGSPFSAENMTGNWKHNGVGSFLVYLAALMLGKKGFVGHDPALLLVGLAAWRLLRNRGLHRPEVLWALAVCGGTWLLYGAASNNSSGVCWSIRWFVPLLAPGYLVLALYLRERPDQLRVLLVLSGAGLLLSAWMMWFGPWRSRVVPYYWPVLGVALIAWSSLALRRGSDAKRAARSPERRLLMAPDGKSTYERRERGRAVA